MKTTRASILANSTRLMIDQIENAATRFLKGANVDVLTIFSPILNGLDARVRWAIERLDRRDQLLVILETGGGYMDVAERIVRTIRQFYKIVHFLVPDRAMSAGTILALSGDTILMDYYSCLGPIDPQMERRTDGGEARLVPVLAYLEQYERLNKKAAKGKLTQADAILLAKLDLAELRAFELERDRSIELVQKWLVEYKFKSWQKPMKTKKARAKEIGEKLNSMGLWGAHSRGINMEMCKEIGLKIDDYSTDEALRDAVQQYYWLLVEQGTVSIVHSRAYL